MPMIFSPSSTALKIDMILSQKSMRGFRNKSINRCSPLLNTVVCAIHKHRLKLRHTEKKSYMNTIQKSGSACTSGKDLTIQFLETCMSVNICSHKTMSYSRKALHILSSGFSDYILHLLQQRGFTAEESSSWTVLPAAQIFHHFKTFGIS